MKRKYYYITVSASAIILIILVGVIKSCGFLTPFLPSFKNPGKELSGIKMPDGFHISVFADNIKGARSMCISPEGILFVGTRGTGKVYAIIDKNKDGKADETYVIASGLDSPNGVAFSDGDLFVAEIRRVIKFQNIIKNYNKNPKYVVVNSSFPKERDHAWKFIAIGPDGRIYVPIGMPCNVCDRKDNFGTIMRMNKDGSGLEQFAKGIRNTVGFDWEPKTNILWFTDNGRDMLGDNKPPDELNKAPKKDMDFGFPYCNGKGFPNPEYKKSDCSKFTPAEIELGPHVAALGMRFYKGNMFPEYYRNSIFIAEHGSWNRSTPIGYRITFVKIEKNSAKSYQTFAVGWLEGETAWGRPVDVQEYIDGSLLISDDKADIIYRVFYQK